MAERLFPDRETELHLEITVKPACKESLTATITNTDPRRDTRGNILDAHDGCLEYFESRFFLYGTRYGDTDGFGTINRYVCYSSTDLTTWTFHGEMLENAPPRIYFQTLWLEPKT